MLNLAKKKFSSKLIFWYMRYIPVWQHILGCNECQIKLMWLTFSNHDNKYTKITQWCHKYRIQQNTCLLGDKILHFKWSTTNLYARHRINLKKRSIPQCNPYIIHLSMAWRKIYFALLTNLNGGQCKHNLLFSIDVGVQYTQNVLKLLRNYKGLWKWYELMRELTQILTRLEKQEIGEEARNFNKKDAVVELIQQRDSLWDLSYCAVQNSKAFFTVEYWQ